MTRRFIIHDGTSYVIATGEPRESVCLDERSFRWEVPRTAVGARYQEFTGVSRGAIADHGYFRVRVFPEERAAELEGLDDAVARAEAALATAKQARDSFLVAVMPSAARVRVSKEVSPTAERRTVTVAGSCTHVHVVKG